MKAIVIFFLLSLTFSLDLEKVQKYEPQQFQVDIYKDIDDIDQSKSQNEVNAKFVSNYLIKEGENFGGCGGKKDEKGRFKDSTKLKNCLEKKDWEPTEEPKMGDIAFMKNTVEGGISHAMIVGENPSLRAKVVCCTLQPKSCSHQFKNVVEIYTKSK